jgi:hypothetical protein
MAHPNFSPPPPPVLNRRVILRTVSLLLMAVFVVWAIWKARKPETWEWVAQANPKEQQLPQQAPVPEEEKEVMDSNGPMPLADEPIPNQLYYEQLGGLLAISPMPTATPASAELRFLVVLAYDHAMPLEAIDDSKRKAGGRRAPEPVLSILQRSLDRQGFMVPEDEGDRKKEGDMQARSHLIEVASVARPEDLAADARRDVRYFDLLGDPARYRGQVIHIEGTLRMVNRFEMHEPPPGVDQFYMGWFVAGRADLDQVYCVLFHELPPGFPPEKDWLQHYIARAKFDGYFLKVLLAQDAKDRRGRLVPVLVGRTVIAPAVARTQEGANWLSMGVTAVFIAAVFVCVVAVFLYRRGDRRMSDRLAALRKRARLPDEIPVDPTLAREFNFEDKPRNGQT